MAHMFDLLDILDYRTPKLKELTIATMGGELSLGGWGLAPPFTDNKYRIGTRNKPMPEDSKIIPLPVVFDPTCAAFLVRGLKVDDEVALFENKGTWDKSNWVPMSQFAKVRQVAANEVEKYLKQLKDKTLPRSTNNSKISFFPYGSMQRTPPISGDDWVRSVEATLSQICSSTLGKAMIDLIDFELIIQCFISDDLNAYSSGRIFQRWTHYIFTTKLVTFSPQTWVTTAGSPGERADEVLLHELIHSLEDNFSKYEDSADGVFKYDNADFVTINGTNVYSSLIGRQLRRDHRGFDPMPAPYNTNPEAHHKILLENYIAAQGANDKMFNTLAKAGGTWNPFSFHKPGTLTPSSDEYTVEVLPEKIWKWIYVLKSNGTAAWRDPKNSAQKGTGTWVEAGGTIRITWAGPNGSWDTFPVVNNFATRSNGRTRTGGVEYNTEVYRPMPDIPIL
jgi:hypothetical protein